MVVLFLAFAFASLIVTISTPFTIRLAKKYKLVDDPTKRPHPAHVQQRIVPRAGGLPIYLSIVISLLLFSYYIPVDKHIIGIILGITVLLIVGLLDDYLENLSPFPRLAMHFISALIVVASGVGITFISNPLGGILHLDQIVWQLNFLGQHNIIVIADIFALLWIVWMMHMINWSKGVDGQMPGIIVAAGITMSILSFKLFINGDPHQLAISVISALTAGAAFGFLIFNWHPAKIFPGQSGSTILGFMIAVLSILSGAKLATALLVLLIPSIDFFYTFGRRVLSGKSPFYGDQKHLHHLLLKQGWSHQRISLFYILSCAILGLLAPNLSSQGKLFTVLGVGVIIIGTIIWLHLFSHQEKQKKVG